MPKVAPGAVPSRRFRRGFSLSPAARATVRLIDGRTGRIRRCRKLASAGPRGDLGPPWPTISFRNLTDRTWTVVPDGEEPKRVAPNQRLGVRPMRIDFGPARGRIL